MSPDRDVLAQFLAAVLGTDIEHKILEAGRNGKYSGLVNQFNERYERYNVKATLEVGGGVNGMDAVSVRAKTYAVATKMMTHLCLAIEDSEPLPPADDVFNADGTLKLSCHSVRS